MSVAGSEVPAKRRCIRSAWREIRPAMRGVTQMVFRWFAAPRRHGSFSQRLPPSPAAPSAQRRVVARSSQRKYSGASEKVKSTVAGSARVCP